jgi:Bacterial Ig domain
MKKLLALLIIWILVTGCSKKSSVEKDNEPPVIVITSPANNQIYSPGQVLDISGSITDNNFIAEVHIHVTNLSTGVKYLDVHIYPAGNSANFLNQSLTTVAGVNYKIQIVAIDRSVNQAVSSVEASCN